MPTSTIDHLAPDKVARIAGGFYLAFVLASVLAGVLGHIGMGGVDRTRSTSPSSRMPSRSGSLLSSLCYCCLGTVPAGCRHTRRHSWRD